MNASRPQQQWWWWRGVQLRLTKWTQALLQGRRYSVELDPKCRSAVHCKDSKSIRVNPQFMPGEEPAIQFRITQALLAHEVGHALFTDAWTGRGENVLAEMANILEDQRVEDAISTRYPGIAPAIDLLGDRSYEAITKRKLRGDAPENAYRLCLYWRWAAKRASSEESFLTKLKVDEGTIALWSKVRPLVEEAWKAPNTQAVIEQARQILHTLGIPESQEPLRLNGVSQEGIPTKRDEKAQPLPKEACPSQVGLGNAPDEQELHGHGATLQADMHSQPTSYMELEEAAQPLANQLTGSLRLPQPDVAIQPHEWLGRYSFRQESRTPETPNRVPLSLDRSSRNLALYLAVDRSGSMGVSQREVRLALMSSYLAAVKLDIPIGISYFGGSDRETNKAKVVFEVTPPTPREDEGVKAMIAGYEGCTGAEYFDWALRLAEQHLLERPERRKVLLVIHDGQPVYSGPDGRDWDLSHAHLRKLGQRGITAIGIYLGDEEEDYQKSKMLFPRLVHTTANQLPAKLGAMLRALAD
jgi:Mg-chelatase subunit ChlD